MLGRCLDDMPPQTRRLLGLVQQMQRERAKQHHGEGGHWRRRELRAFTSWSDTALKVHLGRLVELEYVLASRDPEHLNGQLYETLFDGDPAASRPHLSGLIDVEALRRGEAPAPADAAASGGVPPLAARPAYAYEQNRSGQNGSRSGVGQPSVRGQSGVGQGAEIAASSSENALPASPNGEKRATGVGENRRGGVAAAPS